MIISDFLKRLNLDKGVVGGSIILLVTINIFFVLNYFFHFAMARMLSVADYGIVVTLYSVLYLLGIFTESIQTVISKYSAQESKIGKLKNIIKKSYKKAFFASSLAFIIYLLISLFLVKILEINYSLLAFTGLVIFASFLLPIGRGALQGTKRFKFLGFSMIVEALTKFVFAIFLVLIGWAVFGAMAATLIGIYLSLLVAFIGLRKVFSEKEIKAETPGIYRYTAPVFIVTLSVLFLFTLDVIVARAFFSPDLVGYYAIASTIAKIIFFGTQPISKAMFPLSTESKTKKSSKNVIKTASAILGVLIALAILVVSIAPEILVRIFTGRFIPEASSILIFVAIAISFVSFANLILLYKLSRGKTKGYWFLLFFIIIQVLAMWLFHATLLQFSLAFLVSAGIFFIGSLLLLNK